MAVTNAWYNGIEMLSLVACYKLVGMSESFSARSDYVFLGVSPFRRSLFPVLVTSPYAFVQDGLQSLRKGSAANLHSLEQEVCGSGPQERVQRLPYRICDAKLKPHDVRRL